MNNFFEQFGPSPIAPAAPPNFFAQFDRPSRAASDPYAQPPQGEPSDVATANYGQRAGDLGRAALQGASLGAYQAPPESLARSGPAGSVAQFAGGMLPFATTSGGLGLAGMGAGLGRMAATGAITGAGQAAGTELGTGQQLSLRDIGMGGAFGGAAGALGHGLGAGLGRLGSTMQDIPTSAELPGLTAGAYKKAEELGATYDPGEFDKAVQGIAAKAKKDYISNDVHPLALGSLNRLHMAADTETPIPLMEIESLRKSIGDTMASASPAEQHFGVMIKSGIDDFLKSNPKAYDAIAAARKQAQIGFKDTDLATALTNAKMRSAASTGTVAGSGYEGRIRGALEKLREGKTAWSPDESAQLNNAILGTPVQNAMRFVGRGSNILPLALEGGGAAASLFLGQPGAAAAVAGLSVPAFAAKATSTQMAKNAAEALRQTIRAGGRTPARITPNTDRLAQALAVAALQSPNWLREFSGSRQ